MTDHDLPRHTFDSGTDGVEMRCRTCGARFSRRDAATPEKGRLACHSCGGTDIERTAE
jgi:DNA-directed RNA polymerase subunit RPC12/RpoP